MTRPALQESDLIFSSAASELKRALGGLKKHHLKISNRLESIQRDSEFVCRVSRCYGLPLVANERCGSWYIPPDLRVGSAYFKSTDGHFAQWSFSLRRLNLQVLDVVERYGGCVIVDSTRRGKSMPDALSKTVPIWVCVLNRLLFTGVATEDDLDLSTPMDVVGDSEHAQMESRLDAQLKALAGLGLDIEHLRAKLGGRPLQLAWQRPGDELPSSAPDEERRNLIVCCTASNQTSHETSANSDYVQGAADDPESWSHGLDAATFWKHRHELHAANEDDLPGLIDTLMHEAGFRGCPRAPARIKPSADIWIGTNEAASLLHANYDIIIACAMDPDPALLEGMKNRYITLHLPSGKNGSRLLRTELSKLAVLHELLQTDSRVLVTCETGKDLSVGAALAVLCQYCDQHGRIHPRHSSHPHENVGKALIKQRLSWIVVSIPDANPSRATLQSVNAYLMG